MPYIDDKAKERFEPELRVIRDLFEKTQNAMMADYSPYNKKTRPLPKGELTYVVYALALSYFKGIESYTNISTAISSLQDAAEELRRRHLNPYEDEKIRTNGDVE